MDNWQDKIRKLRRVTEGWGFNIEADLRKLKKYFIEEYDLWISNLRTLSSLRMSKPTLRWFVVKHTYAISSYFLR